MTLASTDTAVEAINKCQVKFCDLPEQLRARKEVALAALQSAGYNFKFVSKALQDDSEVVATAVDVSISMLALASQRLKDDKSFVLILIGRVDSLKLKSLIKQVATKFRADHDVILNLVKRDHKCWKFAHTTLKHDNDFVKAALKASSFPLGLLSCTLSKQKKDRSIVAAAVEAHNSMSQAVERMPSFDMIMLQGSSTLDEACCRLMHYADCIPENFRRECQRAQRFPEFANEAKEHKKTRYEGALEFWRRYRVLETQAQLKPARTRLRGPYRDGSPQSISDEEDREDFLCDEERKSEIKSDSSKIEIDATQESWWKCLVVGCSFTVSSGDKLRAQKKFQHKKTHEGKKNSSLSQKAPKRKATAMPSCHSEDAKRAMLDDIWDM